MPGAEGDEDTQLLLAARKDPAAFDELFVRNWDRVVAYFYRRILCPQTSSELAAETFARAYEHRRRFRPVDGSGAVAWLFGIAGNLHRDWLRRAVVSDRARRRFRIETPELRQDDLDRIESLVDLVEFRGALKEALETLNPTLRDAVLLRIAFDLPYPEVAEELGCSVGAARVRVSRGLGHLLERMEQG